MAHDVFISYASEDKTTADAICERLERDGNSCWMAPRDVLPGVHYAGAIVEAIHQSRVVILVFSSHSNRSHQVLRELERAASRNIPIIPFRIEDVPLSSSMEYFISSHHWLDALTPPIEKHLDQLDRTLGGLLQRSAEPSASAVKPSESGTLPLPQASARQAAIGDESPVRLLPFVAAVLVVVSLSLGAYFAWAFAQPIPELLDERGRSAVGQWIKLPTPPPIGKSRPNQQENPADPQEQFKRAQHYEQVGNYDQAIQWYRRAAEQNHVVAQVKLGLLFDNSRNVSRNVTEARTWYLKAAEHGNQTAFYRLGVMHRYAKDVPRDDVEAYFWYSLAAAKGDARAAQVRDMIAHDLTTAQIAEANQRLQRWRAAHPGVIPAIPTSGPGGSASTAPGSVRQPEGGTNPPQGPSDACAQFQLGQRYERGEGVPQDYSRAVRFYRHAAERGCVQAQVHLGLLLDVGQHVTRNLVEAQKWYRKAADQGDRVALYRLGTLYLLGRGVPRDSVEAYMWFSLASAAGHDRAALQRNNLRNVMTSDQIAEADRRAKQWADSHPRN